MLKHGTSLAVSLPQRGTRLSPPRDPWPLAGLLLGACQRAAAAGALTRRLGARDCRYGHLYGVLPESLPNRVPCAAGGHARTCTQKTGNYAPVRQAGASARTRRP